MLYAVTILPAYLFVQECVKMVEIFR